MSIVHLDSTVSLGHTTTKIEPTSPIDAIILGLWDNVSGPRTEYVWRKDIYDDVFMLDVAKFSLSGELLNCSSKDHGEVATHNFNLLPTFFTTSVVFFVDYDDSTQFSFTVMFQRDYLERYMLVRDNVRDCIEQLVFIYSQVLPFGIKKALDALKSNLDVYKSYINGLLLFENEPIREETFFSSRISNSFCKKLAKVVTSHLQTACTIIVGSDEQLVDKWITTLSHFSSIKERKLVRYGLSKFIPGIVIQGCHSTPPNDLIAQCRLPSTIIQVFDEFNITVKQTFPYNEYKALRKESLFDKCSKLTEQLPLETATRTMWETISDDFLRPVESCNVINIIVFKVQKMQTGLMLQHIKQSLCLFAQQASILVTMVQTMKQKNFEVEEPRAKIAKLKRSFIRNFEIEDSGTFEIILSLAEKLHPGIYDDIKGEILNLDYLGFLEF